MGTSCSSLHSIDQRRQPSFSAKVRKPPVHEPYLIDSDTHQIRAKSAVAFDFVPIRHMQVKPGGSPTRRPIIIPNNNSKGRSAEYDAAHQQLLAKGKGKIGTMIKYNDLVFGVVLGAGTYGEVSSGTWGGRRVAIKKLFPGTSPVETEEVFNDFNREISILRRIKHDRIVSFLGYVQDPHAPFCLVFELLEGNAAMLLKCVRRGEVNITYRVCLGIVKDTADAMAYLHRRTPLILHRDLKAENLLLEKNLRCKLTDFGLSRTFDASKPCKMTVCGTPSWVAPEVFRGDEYSEKVDVYSYGILLWEIFAGKKPYGDKSSADLPYLVGTMGLRPDPLKHVPKALNDLMQQCWAEDPERRPGFGRILQKLEGVISAVTEAHKLGNPVHGSNLQYQWPQDGASTSKSSTPSSTSQNQLQMI